MGKLIRMVDSDGTPAYHQIPFGAPLPEGAVKVSRLPEPFEDFIDGEWVIDTKKKADNTVLQETIREAHNIKYMEAVLITSGYILTEGLLVKEAEQKGITLLGLAQDVLSKRLEFEEKELNRQALQAG